MSLFGREKKTEQKESGKNLQHDGETADKQGEGVSVQANKESIAEDDKTIPEVDIPVKESINVGLMPDGFSILYTEDGIILSLDNKPSSNLQAYAEKITKYLERKKITNLDTKAFSGLLSGHNENSGVIAPPQDEHFYSEDFSISVSDRDMTATMTLTPPEKKGLYITMDDVLNGIKEKYKIVHGLDMDALREILEKHIYNMPTVIAKGTPAVQGENAKLIWHFDTDKEKIYKQIGMEEKIDFKELDLFTPVKQGELLVEKTMPTPGTQGSDIFGKELKALPGKNINLPKGKNTSYSEDKSAMYAASSGMVEIINGVVVVSNVYTINGDVDMSVGNIDFDGDVFVKGGVIGGITIKASGNIIILGTVEAAVIEAQGDIFLKGGIQGAGKGYVNAGGTVTAKFVEYATIQAGNKIISAYFIHGNGAAENAIEVVSGKGCIIGGHLTAGSFIAAKTIGTNSGIITTIEVGFSKVQRERLKYITEEIQSNEKKIVQMARVVKADAAVLSQRQQALRQQVIKDLYDISEATKELKTEKETLEAVLMDLHAGFVHVTDKAYAGVNISISSAFMTTKIEYDYSTFKIEEGDIKIIPCAYRN